MPAQIVIDARIPNELESDEIADYLHYLVDVELGIARNYDDDARPFIVVEDRATPLVIGAAEK